MPPMHYCKTMRLLRHLVMLFVLIAPVFCNAATAGFGPINLHHSSWTAKDGAPASIIGVAQTPDRWMWIASLNGLYRFDGAHFYHFGLGDSAAPRIDVWGMRVFDNGDLWIGHRFGGVSLWRNGSLRSFGAADGFNVSSVLDFAEDADGRVWASTAHGFRVFDGRHWRTTDESRSGRTGACFLAKDAQAVLWARCETGVYRLPKGADAFGPKVLDLSFGRLAAGADGTLWATGGGANELIPLSGPGKQLPLPAWPRPRGGSGPMFFERDGQHVWSSQPTGVIRYGPQETGRTFGVPNGLSGTTVNCFYQDDEGNIWVGTENGLDRFRPTALSGVAIPPSYWDAEAIAAGDGGALWVGGVELASPDVQALSALPAQNAATAVSVVYRDGDDVWTGGRDGLWHYRAGKRTRVPLPDYVTVMQFSALCRDGEGGLWVSARGVGLIRWKDGGWQRGGGRKELEAFAYAMARDSSGRIWFGFADSRLLVLDGGTLRAYGRSDGLAAGAIVHILPREQQVWIGGADGVYHFDGQRFFRLAGEEDEAFLGASGLIDYAGTLWINGAAGIMAVDQREIARARADARYRVAFRRLNHLDGLHGAATNFFPAPTAVMGTDGKLWFSTSAGIFWLDPNRQLRNPVPPRLSIQAINVDHASVAWAPDTVANIAPNPGRLRIDYTALSFSMPERLRFQYRLDGVDRDWQEGGSTRSATYTGLAPGRYRFQVRAANHDGVSSVADGVVQFEVRPAYYQSVWLRALGALLLALLAWMIYKLRVAQIARRAVERYAIRMAERERIARDLHDTLMQSLHALSLRLSTMLNRLPGDTPARGEIARSLDLVEAALQEGQDKLHGLRRSPAVDILSQVRETMLAEYPQLPLTLLCSGAFRELAAPVREQLVAIALEALRNAARHAAAVQIGFEVRYDSDAFRMTIHDNGCGLPAPVAVAGCSAGRWGLVGMRERAAQLGAQIALETEPGMGTRITVCLAAARAYCD